MNKIQHIYVCVRVLYFSGLNIVSCLELGRVHCKDRGLRPLLPLFYLPWFNRCTMFSIPSNALKWIACVCFPSTKWTEGDRGSTLITIKNYKVNIFQIRSRRTKVNSLQTRWNI